MARGSKVLTQALIYLTNQPVGSITSQARLGISAETQLWKSQEMAIVMTVTMYQRARLLRTPSPITTGKELSTGICNGMLPQDG